MSPEDLRCDVVGGAAEGGGGVPRPQALLAHPVVRQLDVSVMVQQDIVQLQITVDHTCRGGGEGRGGEGRGGEGDTCW